MTLRSNAVPPIVAALGAIALAVTAAGCGGGYDEDEAAAACNAFVGSVDTSDQEAYDRCIDCYVECGDECAVLESYPPRFACPE
jgi:hypothetical protein